MNVIQKEVEENNSWWGKMNLLERVNFKYNHRVPMIIPRQLYRNKKLKLLNYKTKAKKKSINNNKL